MRDDVDALEEHVTQVRSETEAHAAAIGAADMAEAMAEETRHHDALTGHADSMGSVMEHMGTCQDGMGNPPDTMPMDEAIQDLLAECTNHVALMGSAGNMVDVASEEQRHQGAMGMMLDGMEPMMGSMMEDAGDYECSGGMMGGG